MRIGRLLLVAGNAALVALFAAAFVARFIPPSWVWWLQVMGLGLPVFALLVAGFAARWALAGRWWLAAGHLALALLVVPRYVSPPSVGGEGSEPELRVVSFNAKPRYLAANGATDITVLLDDTPHILALQGVAIRLRPGGMVSTSAELWPLLRQPGFELARPTSVGVLRLPIFTSLPWQDAAQPYKDDRPGEGPTRVSTAEIEWQGAAVTVINVHLESFGERRPWRGGWRERLSPAEWARALRDSREAFIEREEDARRVRELVDAAGDRPVIVAGDLNATADQWSYWHIKRGLTDAAVARGRAFAPTYHARFPLVRIDHILVSPQWQVQAFAVHRQPASDHLPVTATLALRDTD